jgi:tetratricopeptide (TPR) repeat protein
MTNTSSLVPQQAMGLAAQLETQGRLSEAEALYRRAVAADPACHPAYHRLGLLAFRVNRLELAAELIESAIALNADIAVYHRDRGELCRRLGRFEDAVREAAAATRLAPDDPEGHYNMGLALADQQDYVAAVTSYRRAIERNPAHGLALNNLGSALQQLGDQRGAADAFRAAIAVNPRHVEALNNLGSILSQSGDIAGARDCFEKALAVEPQSIVSHYNVSALKRYSKADDASVAVLEALANSAEKLPLQDRTRLYFALGKVRDDLGDYDRAFAAYAAGNRAHANAHPYDEARVVRQGNDLIELFDRKLIDRFSGSGSPDRTPVFIVGMPRSGTSLTEQILASHPDVHGAGELKDFHRVVGEVSGGPAAGPFPRSITALSGSQLRAIADGYLASVRALAPSAARITDKMPGNFHYLGLIHLTLPNAKVIHTLRDPMDSCLSCYTHLFNDSMDFTYDLKTLGRYYVRYMRLMEHWRTVLPEGFILDVRYEDLVNDVEWQTRRMLIHIDLPWDARCLEFYNTQRPVRTASLAQVRQPIYKSSVAGWKRFERQLQPLLDIVADYRQ